MSALSGLELVGLVLAVWPVITEGLIGFNSLKGKTFIPRRTITNVRRDLDAEEARFCMACKRLLNQIVDEDRLEDLLDDPNSQGWKNRALNTKLKERLGNLWGLNTRSLLSSPPVSSDK